MEDRINYRQSLGKIGEDIACRHLQKMGHMIVKRNYRHGHLELDIISHAEDGIHFVEVKSRRKNIQAPPQENVKKNKQKRISQAALGYLKNSKNLPCSDYECHFDIIAVTFQGEDASVEWIPDAYIPIYI